MNENYIRIYQNAVPDIFCDKLIEQFENNPSQWLKQDRKNPDRNFQMLFNQIHVMEHNLWKDDVKYMMDIFQMYLRKYKEDCNIKEKQWPEQYGFEQIRMKRYLPNDKDEFKNHVDVGDHASARRFLVFFLYLNDNFGGQTSFKEYDTIVQPQTGKLLMFPPTWTYLHAGHKPIKTPKYIIGSYLHYL